MYPPLQLSLLYAISADAAMSLGTILKRAVVSPLLGLGMLGGLLTGYFFSLETYSGLLQGYLGRTGTKLEQQAEGKKAEFSPLDRPAALFMEGLRLPAPKKKLQQAYQESAESAFNLNVYDKQGELFYSDRNLFRTLATEEISPHVFTALQAAEDKHFSEHYGWNTVAFGKALAEHIFLGEPLRGASTITIQLADFLLWDHPNQYQNKVREWALASVLEEQLSKEEIITHYLNLAPFGYAEALGRPITGIEGAAQYYFNKPANDLNLLESIALVGSLKRGNFASKAYKEAMSKEAINKEEWTQQQFRELDWHDQLVERSKYILGQARDLEEVLGKQLFEEREYYAVLQLLNDQKIPFQRNKGCRSTDSGYDYRELVNLRLQRLHQKYGLNASQHYDLYTFFDPKLQEFVQDAFQRHLARIRREFPASQQKEINGAVIVLNLKHGGIEALIGGEGDSLNKALQSYTQPGSTFKPFVLSAALSDGRTLQSTIKDIPYEFSVGRRTYAPRNYSGRYSGEEFTLERALVQSRNNIFTKLAHDLITEKGKEYLLKHMHNFGFQFHDFPLSYALGTKELSLLELLSGYAVFAYSGNRYCFEDSSCNNRVIGKIVTEDHTWENEPRRKAVISPTVANDVDSTLRKVVSEGTGRKADLPGMEVRGKTGTGETSVSFLGYVPETGMMVGVLFASEHPKRTGNFPHPVAGGEFAAPLFAEIAKYYSSR